MPHPMPEPDAMTDLPTPNANATPDPKPPTMPQTHARCPPAALARLLAASRLAPTELSTLTVTPAASALFEAVLEYAVLHSAGASRTPHRVDSLTYSRKHLRLLSQDTGRESSYGCEVPEPYRPDDDDDGDLASLDEDSRLPTERPCFTLGFGETAVVWPPPARLRAHYLREKERLEQAAEQEVSEPTRTPRAAPEADDDTDDTDDGSSRHVFYIVHFGVGNPQPMCDGLKQYSEIFVGTPASDETLQQFTREILIWDTQRRSKRETSETSFELHRFRMDEGGNGYWNNDGEKKARPISSVILAPGRMDAIVNDITNFLKPHTRKWYQEHGLPQRRSYLFFGPPGTGKTSTIRALASRFKRPCCFLSMANSAFSNQALGDALASMPPRALMVIEDVDALFTKTRKSRSGSPLSFSGLLNALDGVMSADGAITIMTTNFVDRLDDALLRAGRVDRRFYFGPPGRPELIDLFRSFYPLAADSTVTAFANAVLQRPERDRALSVATLQQLFIDRRETSPEECVGGIDSFFRNYFPVPAENAAAARARDADLSESVGDRGERDEDGVNEIDGSDAAFESADGADDEEDSEEGEEGEEF